MAAIPSLERTSGASAREVLWVFLRLGCTSFGGPVAHLGYFRREFVERRAWLTESTFAELVAVSQALPGPGSSQVGFSIGLLRAGWPGGLAAWLGFTLPSALLMTAFAFGHSLWSGAAGMRVFHGLQLVAVAVVAQALVTMQRSLAPDLRRIAIATVAAALVLTVPWQLVNLAVIVIAAVVGTVMFSTLLSPAADEPVLKLRPSSARFSGIAFLAMLGMALPGAYSREPLWATFAAFYRSGALVFGGGHVVLPLLEHAVVARGWVSQSSFLAGYGAVQAVPGPVFTFAAYLGASSGIAGVSAPQRLMNAAAALLGIFLPGLLAMAAVLPLWGSLRSHVGIRAALLGINASVVGILAAALVHPLWTSTVHSPIDLIVAATAFLLLWVPRVQPWMIVLAVAALSAVSF